MLEARALPSKRFPRWDTSSFPEELKVMIELLRDKRTQGVCPDPNPADGFDWRKFAELSIHHRVHPLILRRLREGWRTDMPQSVLDRLEAQCRNNTMRMLHLTAETGRLAVLFRERNIRVLVLKGPALSLDLYGDLSIRPSGDVDLLVPIADIDEADRLLRSQGYVKDDYIRTVLDDWRWRHHHYAYLHPETGAKIELHWRMHPWPAREPAFDALWGRRRTMMLGGRPVDLPGLEDTFLYLASHGARHGWSRLRWLLDIDRIARQPIRWDQAAADARRLECGHICGQSLRLAAGLLGTPIPDGAGMLADHPRAHELAEEALFYIGRVVNLHSPPLPPEVARYHSRHLLNLMTSRQRLLFRISWLHPYHADAEALPLPKTLHFLYFPLRPVLWAWRKARSPVIRGRTLLGPINRERRKTRIPARPGGGPA
mgnify:CR=1 FL=1